MPAICSAARFTRRSPGKSPTCPRTSPFDGYSDHTVGIETVLLAISRGARVIEKHFTLDKSDTTIRDHALSATPEEFRHMVQLGRAFRRCLDVGQQFTSRGALEQAIACLR